jgi:hypothetical protein
MAEELEDPLEEGSRCRRMASKVARRRWVDRRCSLEVEDWEDRLEGRRVGPRGRALG